MTLYIHVYVHTYVGVGGGNEYLISVWELIEELITN